MDGFYNAQNAPLAARILYEDLLLLWAKDTCAPRLRANWETRHKSFGQCSITAFLAQDLLGGKVFGIPLADGNFHCFNVMDGIAFDLTSEQFDTALDYSSAAVEQSREIHFAKAEKRERYQLLKARLDALRAPRKVQIAPLPGSGFRDLAPDLFAILQKNYRALRITEPEIEDYELWFSNVSEGLEKPQRRLLTLSADGLLSGFFLYYAADSRFMMEEIQLVPELQGKRRAFRDLYGYLIEHMPEDTEVVEAFAHTTNTRSRAILEHLGLQPIGQSPSGRHLHYRGAYSDLLSWYRAENGER